MRPFTNTASIPRFLSKTDLANKPTVLTASESKSQRPALYLRIHFIRFTSNEGIYPLLTISNPSSTFPLLIVRVRTFKAT